MSLLRSAIAHLHEVEGFGISAVCAAIGVPRSSYYSARSDDPADGGIRRQIEEIFREHRRRYGSRRISQELARRGIRCGRARVRRIMTGSGLRALKAPKRFVPQTSDGGAPAPSANLLGDLDPPTASDQVWVTDITYIPVAGQKWLYLAVVMDLFSRRIIGWKLGRSLHSEIVVAALRCAVRTRRPKPGLIAHSDRGSQYGSATYRRHLDAIGAIQSMSRKGNCYDNSSMESCFGSIKDEMLEDGIFQSFGDAHTELFEYIESYYNRKRIHSSIGGIPPVEFETKNT